MGVGFFPEKIAYANGEILCKRGKDIIKIYDINLPDDTLIN